MDYYHQTHNAAALHAAGSFISLRRSGISVTLTEVPVSPEASMVLLNPNLDASKVMYASQWNAVGHAEE